MKKLSIFLVTILVVATVFLAAHSDNLKEESLLLKQALQSYILPEGVLEETASTQYLRKAWYATATRIDPLFSLEGTDLDKLEKAIELVHRSRFHYATIPPRNTDDKEVLEQVLYPQDFLESLPKLERLRRDVVAHPNHRVITAYHRALLRTLSAYLEAIENQKVVFAKHMSEQANARFYFPAGYTTPEKVLSTFKNLELGAHALKEKAEKRFACSKRYTKTCEDLNTLKLLAPINQKPDLNQALLSEVREIVLASHDNKASVPNTKNVREIVLSGSTCTIFENPVYHISQKYLGYNDIVTIPLLINDQYFLRTDVETTSPFTKKLKEAEILLYSQSSFTPYLCPDSGSELSRIHTLLYLQEALSANSFSERLGTLLQDAKQDQSFLDEEFIYEYSIMHHLANLHSLIQGNGEKEIEKYLGTNDTLLLTSLIRQTVNQSAVLPDMLLEIAKRDMSAALREKGMSFSFELIHTLIQRGHQSILFSTFNKSFTPYQQPFLARTHESNLLAEFEMHSYVDEIRDEFSFEKILEIAYESAESIKTVENRPLLFRVPPIPENQRNERKTRLGVFRDYLMQ